MVQVTKQQAFVEIVAKKKGCVLCDLAVAILEEIACELEGDVMSWDVVDVGDREGLRRYAELSKICGRKPPVPSIVINDKIAFDNIPDYESLHHAILDVVHDGLFNNDINEVRT